MKITSTIFFLLVCLHIAVAQNVGIGTNTPHSSALLELSSTSKGLLLPRMTTAQRNAIASPAKGLVVYDTDLNAAWHFNGSNWAAVGGGGGGFSLPFEGSVNLGSPGFKVTNNGAGAAIQATTTNEFGYGLFANNTTNYGYSVYAYARSPNAVSVFGTADSATAMKAESDKGIGLDAKSNDSNAIRARILVGANADAVILASHAGSGNAVHGTSVTGAGVYGSSAVQASALGGVVGVNTHATGGYGVVGIAQAVNSSGVYGSSNNGTGVTGYSNAKYGVAGSTISGTALYGNSTTGYGLESVGKIKISGGNTNPAAGAVLTSVDASGNAVWQTNKVAFGVEGVNTNYNVIPHSVYRKIHFAPVGLYDLSNSYQLLIGTNVQPNSSSFIVPVNGIYHFDVGCEFGGINYDNEPTVTAGELRLQRNRNGAISTIATNQYPDVYKGGYISNARLTISRDFSMQAGDIIYCEVYHKNATSQNMGLMASPYTYFTGSLLKTY